MKSKFGCLNIQDTNIPTMFRLFGLKMEEQSIPAIVINIFKCYYSQLVYGAQGKLTENEIEPVGDEEVTGFEALEKYSESGRKALGQCVIVKLNGGLGTSMGLEKAKSLISVKEGATFLDLIIDQVRMLRERTGKPVPLALMNSFNTHKDTMIHIGEFNNAGLDIPISFLQHRYPKVLEESLAPAERPDNPQLEWNPPGHGDVYTALITSGLLSKLLRKGVTHAFISNSDNLGASMDERILGYMVEEKLPFLMEVCRRTQADKKGGHLCRLKKTKRLKLREIAQCPENELETFQDINRYKFFNTNSLWVDLHALEQVFLQHHMIPLDLILNPKNLDPRDPRSPRVLQVETAMGAAISAFDKAQAVLVPRRRFAPVKTTADLLLVMSDCYTLTRDKTLEPIPVCDGNLPQISLDSKYYKKIDDFYARFPQGPPSLKECSTLTVEGDVLFGKDVVLKGDVRILNSFGVQTSISDGSVIEGKIEL